MLNQTATQVQIIEQEALNTSNSVQQMAFFDADGAPINPVQTGDTVPFAVITTATAIGTAAKTTTSVEPADNTLVLIKFTNGNSAASPTVAFNGGTARAVQLAGAAPASGEVTIAANGIGLFFFDGTILHQVGVLS